MTEMDEIELSNRHRTSAEDEEPLLSSSTPSQGSNETEIGT
jgi:hypothetical protein